MLTPPPGTPLFHPWLWEPFIWFLSASCSGWCTCNFQQASKEVSQTIQSSYTSHATSDWLSSPFRFQISMTLRILIAYTSTDQTLKHMLNHIWPHTNMWQLLLHWMYLAIANTYAQAPLGVKDLDWRMADCFEAVDWGLDDGGQLSDWSVMWPEGRLADRAGLKS